MKFKPPHRPAFGPPYFKGLLLGIAIMGVFSPGLGAFFTLGLLGFSLCFCLIFFGK
jgi:hypothetical protein